MLSELRFKQTQDKWSTLLKNQITTPVDPSLRLTSSREADFEKTLKRVQRAEEIKRAPLKKDLDKVLKVVGSFIKDLGERVKQSKVTQENHTNFLKKMAATDEEAVNVLSRQERLMEVLAGDGKALKEYMLSLKKNTKKENNDDFDMDEGASSPTAEEYVNKQKEMLRTIQNNEKDITRIWSELISE